MIAKPVLRLTLKKKWYDIILSGKKKEEYREIKDYWRKRFRHDIKIKSKYYHPLDVIIEFRNGYRKDSPRMWFECKGLRIGYARPDWIEDWKEEQIFIISLGKQIINDPSLKEREIVRK